MLRLAKSIYFIIALLITGLIIIKSFDYWSPDFSHGFLLGKESIFNLYRYFLYIHMLSAPIAIIAGIFQFSFLKSRAHKAIGLIYMVSVVVFAAPSGFFMAFYAIGGFWSTINFILLSALWLFFTVKAFLHIKHQRVADHRKFMIRSFILANSAIMIRLLSFINNHYQIMDPVTGYVIIVWLSWLPALLFYELSLSSRLNNRLSWLK